MAKREFIETREIVYVNAPIAPILQGDSIHYEDIAFKSQIGRIHSFSEQDIVKPILDKIRERVERLQKACGKDDLNWQAQYSAFSMVLDIIDEYKAESEVEDGNDD